MGSVDLAGSGYGSTVKPRNGGSECLESVVCETSSM